MHGGNKACEDVRGCAVGQLFASARTGIMRAHAGAGSAAFGDTGGEHEGGFIGCGFVLMRNRGLRAGRNLQDERKRQEARRSCAQQFHEEVRNRCEKSLRGGLESEEARRCRQEQPHEEMRRGRGGNLNTSAARNGAASSGYLNMTAGRRALAIAFLLGGLAAQPLPVSAQTYP